MAEKTLADVLESYAHDGAFCGRMTSAGIPCQRHAHPLAPGCPRHNGMVEALRQLRSVLEAFGEALSSVADAVGSYRAAVNAHNERRRERRRIQAMYIEFDPADQPPALEAPPR